MQPGQTVEGEKVESRFDEFSSPDTYANQTVPIDAVNHIGAKPNSSTVAVAR
jgi:hypothetical protein